MPQKTIFPEQLSQADLKELRKNPNIFLGNTPNQYKKYKPKKTAAKQSGISAKQIFDWLQQPSFRHELENRKNEGVNQAVDRLKATASKACDTLIGLLDHAESESVRHRVAIDMLNMTLKLWSLGMLSNELEN